MQVLPCIFLFQRNAEQKLQKLTKLRNSTWKILLERVNFPYFRTVGCAFYGLPARGSCDFRFAEALAGCTSSSLPLPFLHLSFHSTLPLLQKRWCFASAGSILCHRRCSYRFWEPEREMSESRDTTAGIVYLPVLGGFDIGKRHLL